MKISLLLIVVDHQLELRRVLSVVDILRGLKNEVQALKYSDDIISGHIDAHCNSQQRRIPADRIL